MAIFFSTLEFSLCNKGSVSPTPISHFSGLISQKSTKLPAEDRDEF